MKKRLERCKTKSLDSKIPGGVREEAGEAGLCGNPLGWHQHIKHHYHFLRKRLSPRIHDNGGYSYTFFSDDRNCFQQRRKMEGSLAFLPHGFAEYGDGGEEYRRQNSRGAAGLVEALKKTTQWCVFLYVIRGNSLGGINAVTNGLQREMLAQVQQKLSFCSHNRTKGEVAGATAFSGTRLTGALVNLPCDFQCHPGFISTVQRK